MSQEGQEEANRKIDLMRRVLRDQRVAYLIVGGVNTVLGYLLFVAFEAAFGERFGRFGYMVSLLCSYAVAIVIAFLLQRTFVFRVTGHFWLDLARFTAINLAALAINSALLPLAVEFARLRPVYAQGAVALITAVITFAGHKYFSFRRRA